MLLVTVRYQEGRVPGYVLEALTGALPAIVASALHIEEDPDAHLTVDDVMVDSQAIGRFAVNVNVLDISIDANESPRRLLTINDRCRLIVGHIRTMLFDYDPNIVCGVRVRLFRGSYEVL